MSEVVVGSVTYYGGFTHLGLDEPRVGRLKLDADALTLDRVQNEKFSREYRAFEVCRTKAIASVEITSGQAAQSRMAAVAFFGVLGGLAAKGSADRATMLVTLKNGETGYLTINKQSTPSLLAKLSPWIRDNEIEVTRV